MGAPGKQTMTTATASPGRGWIWATLRWSGLPLLARTILQRNATTILFYHDIDPSALDRHLGVLGQRYHFIPLRQYVSARRSDRMSSLPRRALVVTLDDGVRGNFALLDVFRRHGVLPTIFLTSGIVGTDRRFWWTMVPGGRPEVERLKTVPDQERVASLVSHGHSETERCPTRSTLSRDEIARMKESVDFQAHTVLHPILSRCTDERAWAEISGSRSDLEREHGLDIYALAYPNGTANDFGEREVGLAARAGYGCAVTTIPGLNGPHSDLFRLRRVVVPEDASGNEIVVKASLVNEYLKRLLLFARGSRPDR